MVVSEVHMRIHLLAALIVLALAWFLAIGGWQLAMLLTAIVLVMVTEIFNTALEKLCDVVQPEWDARIGFIKDICSAAVFLSALFALAIAIIVFIPAIQHKLH